MNEISALDIPEDTRYWFIRANSQAQYYDDFQLNNYIAIDSNSLPLQDLTHIPTTIRASDDALEDRYKSIFQEHDLKKFNTKNKNNEDNSNYKLEQTKELRKSTNRAHKAYHFIEDFGIGDFVIVPYKSSTKFLIGVIVSDCFEHAIDHINLLDEDDEPIYDISNFQFKRRVLWIKELPRKKFPDKLSWIKTAHQSIFEITDYANDVTPVICPFYRYKGRVYTRLGVNTTSKISSSSWLQYQLLLSSIAADNLDNIYQKQKVQAPGDIILYVEKNLWWILPLIIGSLFGETTFSHGPFTTKWQGIIRYFSKGERLKRSLSVENEKLKTQNSRAALNNKNADTLAKLNEINPNSKQVKEASDQLAKSIQLEIARRSSVNTQRIEEGFSEEIQKENITPPTKVDTNDVEKTLNDFKLSNENPGSLLPYETQEDNLNSDLDESEQQEGSKR